MIVPPFVRYCWVFMFGMWTVHIIDHVMTRIVSAPPPRSTVTAPRSTGLTPVELTAPEIASPFVTKAVPPIEIVLRFVPWDEFRRIADDPLTRALTFINRHPCEVVIPAGLMIQASPADPYSGQFVRSRDSDMVAHELLHCVSGQWHKPVPRLKLKDGEVMSGADVGLRPAVSQ